MMVSNRRIVWMPVLSPRSVTIYVSSHFARECYQYTLADPKKLSERIRESMGEKKEWYDDWLELAKSRSSQQRTLLVQSFHKGRGGLRVTADALGATKMHLSSSVLYHSHHADTCMDREWVMSAFNAWVTAADVYLKNSK